MFPVSALALDPFCFVVLLSSPWDDQYQNKSNFEDYFFDKFQSLKFNFSFDIGCQGLKHGYFKNTGKEVEQKTNKDD